MATQTIRLPGRLSGRHLGLGGAAALGTWLYLIWLPVSNNRLLYSFLGALALLALLGSLSSPRLSDRLVLIVAVQFTFGLFGVAIGVINHNPGVNTQALLYLVTPVIYWLCVKAVDARMLARIMKLGVWVTIILSVVIIVYAKVPGVFPSEFAHIEQTGAGEQALRFIGLESLLILGPLCTASLVFPSDKHWLPSLHVRLLASIAALVAIILSGRQALIVIDILSPIIALVVGRRFRVSRVRKAKFRRPMRKANAALPLLVLGALFLIAEVLPTHAFNNAILSTAHLLDGGGSQYPVVAAGNVLDGGDVSSLSSTQILRYETPALLRGWAQHPIQGAGFGAILPGYARNVEKPWGFEAQYPLLLFQTGLIGLALLAIIARWGWRFLRRAALKTSDHGLATVLVVTTTAVICVLVANAADPYLQAPGVCWGMYLPFAAANLALTARNPHPPTEIPVDFGGSSR